MKKRIIIASAAVLMGGLATVAGGTAATYAATATSTKPTGIVRRADGERGRAKLNQAVRDGVITDTQKTAFETEVKTLREERKSVLTKTSTQAEREAEHAKLKSELKAWATTNNFPLAKIFPKLAE